MTLGSSRWRGVIGTVIAALVLAATLWAWRSKRRAPLQLPSPPAVPAPLAASSQHQTRRLGGLDLTFLVFADTHLGFESAERDASGALHDPVATPQGVEPINGEAIRDMNSIAGRAW